MQVVDPINLSCEETLTHCALMREARRGISLLLLRFLLGNVDTAMVLLLPKETSACLSLTRNTGSLPRMT